MQRPRAGALLRGVHNSNPLTPRTTHQPQGGHHDNDAELRLLATATTAAACALATATAASALPPDRVLTETYDADVAVEDEFLTDECGFPVTAQLKGRYQVTVFFDRHGSVRQVTAHPSFRTTLSSPTTTLRTSDVGLDRYVFTEDGMLTIFGTGIHLTTPHGPKAIGLWRLVIDPTTGDLVSEEYHGRFDVTEPELTEALCNALR